MIKTIIITYVASIIIDRIWLKYRKKGIFKYRPQFLTYLAFPTFHNWLVAIGFYDLWQAFKQRKLITTLRTWSDRRIKRIIIKRSRQQYRDKIGHSDVIKTENKKAKQREFVLKQQDEKREKKWKEQMAAEAKTKYDAWAKARQEQANMTKEERN